MFPISTSAYWDEVDTGNFRDNGEGLGSCPGVIHERTIPTNRSVPIRLVESESEYLEILKQYSLRSMSSELTCSRVRAVQAIIPQLLREYLIPHDIDSFLSKIKGHGSEMATGDISTSSGMPMSFSASSFGSSR